jgi:hypothetical protein
MADGVAITAGSGTTIATDDAGVAGHVQLNKLAISADGSATLIPADAANGLDVDVTRVSGTVNVSISQLNGKGNIDGITDNVTVNGIGTGANDLGKAEDAVHNTGDAGIMALAVRKDTPANLSGTDGDYEPLQISGGRLHVGLSTSTVAGAASLPAGTNNIGDVDVLSVIPGTGATNLGKAEDASHADADTGVMALAVRDDSGVNHTVNAQGDYTPLTTDATGKLWVRPTPKVVRLSVTPTISSGSAYTSGDVVGGQMTFSGAVRVAGGSGTILSIMVLDKSQAQRAAMDLLFFDRSVTVAADNAAFATSDGDMANCLGICQIGPYNTAWAGTPLNSISYLANVNIPIVLNGTDLYVAAVVRAGPTYGSTSDLVFVLTILQD